MWPWEHVAVGYIAYSLLSRTVVARRPGVPELFAVLLGSLGPDLIDKPLAWGLGVLPGGYSLGHSVFFAVPLALAAVGVAALAGRGSTGVAFGLSYLLHLPADVYYFVVFGDPPAYGILFWPLVPAAGGSIRGDLLSEALRYFTTFLADVTTPEAVPFLVGEALLLATAAFLLWRDTAARRRGRPEATTR
ncbi:metal-dependent hydrolase [Halobium salinum]|uniref:Metal-dependent hydrolase n=1 Tax=Halobium salinum TaxID=1364940 RepID=A0ABD5PA96_9EURY|nr:metal-dependent hydrolase [Halobium salinum]